MFIKYLINQWYPGVAKTNNLTLFGFSARMFNLISGLNVAYSKSFCGATWMPNQHELRHGNRQELWYVGFDFLFFCFLVMPSLG